jgi:hypothetical protein
MPNDVLSAQHAAFFAANGFVLLPALLDPDEAARLREEVAHNIQRAYDIPAPSDGPATGYDGLYLPLAGPQSPLSRALTSDPVMTRLAGTLLGRPPVPKPAKGMIYGDASAWHRDSDDADLHAVKIACYLEPLSGETGALRVLPGSHHPAYSNALSEYRAQWPSGTPLDEDDEQRRWPGVVLATKPGDAVIFDVHLWHASLFGRHRSQWTVSFAATPESQAEAEAVRRYIALFLSVRHVYDHDTYPYYDPDWLGPGAPTFAATMKAIGLFDLDDTEK